MTFSARWLALGAGECQRRYQLHAVTVVALAGTSQGREGKRRIKVHLPEPSVHV